jgi:hypothetical protein
MERAELVAAAVVVVKRNLAPNIEAATVDWVPAERCLKLTYFFSKDPSESDEESCELAAGELAGEFPEVLKIDLQILLQKPASKESERASWVYRRTD